LCEAFDDEIVQKSITVGFPAPICDELVSRSCHDFGGMPITLPITLAGSTDALCEIVTSVLRPFFRNGLGHVAYV
jgi:hypothetical protein